MTRELAEAGETSRIGEFCADTQTTFGTELAGFRERTEFDEVAQAVYAVLRVLVFSFAFGHCKASF